MAAHFSADQWLGWFLEFDQSGTTVAKFCDSIGVSVQSYYKWRRKLKLLPREQAIKQTQAPNFVSVVVTASKVEVEFPGGVIARLSNDADSLRPLVKVLLEQGANQ